MLRQDTFAAQKTLAELIARYSLEPKIRDIFVEGRSDAAFIKRFVRTQQLEEIAVYEISSVEIPASSVLSAKLPDGARGRVVYLAFEFEKNLPASSKAATCVADRDYDEVLHRSYKSPFLFFWDYCSVEMYAYSADTLRNLLSAIAPALEESGARILNEIQPLLQALFLIRAANISLGLNLRWLSSFHDSCVLKNGSIQFDQENFIDRYLSKNASLSKKEQFTSEVARLSSEIKGEPRLFIRGHDFVEVLSWYLREHSSRTSLNYRPEVLGQLLLAHVNHSTLATTVVFQNLLKRIS
jgi:hypothetical protein